MRKSYFVYIILALLFALVLSSCTNDPGTTPITPDTPEEQKPAMVYGREYWGEWKKMDQSETWLINSTSITVNGTILSKEVTLAKPSENVISATINGQTDCLYAVRTASSSITGNVTTGEASKGIGDGWLSVVIQNMNDIYDIVETKTDSDGHFTADNLIAGEEYNVKINDTSLNITPSFDGENIGTITLMSGVNFKVTISNTNSVMYAGSEYYSMNLIIENIGDTNCTAATYSLTCDDGLDVINNYTDGVLLRTVAVGEKKIIPLKVKCSVPETETAIRKLNLTITDKNGTTWNDSVSLKFYRDSVTINVVSENGRPISGVIIGDGRTYSITNRTNYSISIPVTAESYLMVFSGAIANASRNTESAYSIGVNCPSTTATALLTELGIGTNSHEPNDDENSATLMTVGQSLVTYLYENDIDYFFLESMHLFDDGMILKAATCTDDGSRIRTCSVCGITITETIPATGHPFSSTWENDTIYHWHNSTCEHLETAGKAEHVWDDGVVTVSPTCSNPGSKTLTCLICGRTKEVQITVPHTLDEGLVVLEPTHTTEGIRRHLCTVCGQTVDVAIPVLAEAHTFAVGWTSDEEQHWHASTCGHDVVSEKTAHDWDIGLIIKQPTSTEPGILSYTCKTCGHTKDIVISKLYYIGETGPAGGKIFYDCDADNDSGNADGLISSECGWRYLEFASGDLYDNGHSLKFPSGVSYQYGYNGTCYYGGTPYLVNGTATYNPDDCTGTAIGTGKRNTELLVAAMGEKTYESTADSLKRISSVAYLVSNLTTEYNGTVFDDWFLPSKDELTEICRLFKADFHEGSGVYQSYWSSSESNEYNAWVQYMGNVNSSFERSRDSIAHVRPIRAFLQEEFGIHHFVSALTKNPTCTDTGTKTYTCTSCGLIIEKSLPALGHSFSNEWTSDDEFHWHASTCGHDVAKDKEEHNWVAGAVLSEPTHSTEGLQRFECSICGQIKTEAIPKTGYEVGEIGPTGGYIFYDCDADNGSGNEDGLISSACGWRYLEAAPSDLRIVDEIITVSPDWSSGSSIEYIFKFGYYRLSDDSPNLFTNGTKSYSAKCTSSSIGSGASNTELLVSKMGDEAYAEGSGALKELHYAAKLCKDLNYNGFDDWFLPSELEMHLIRTELYNNGIGDLSGDYWSSSENPSLAPGYIVAVYCMPPEWGNGMSLTRDYEIHIRPVRAFQQGEPEGHIFESIITKAPSCVETGVKQLTCIGCGYTCYEIIPTSDNHDYNEYECTLCHKERYSLGDTGPAGGVIVAIASYYGLSDVSGWHYIEAAPADMHLIKGVPSIDSSAEGYSSGVSGFLFECIDNGVLGVFVNGQPNREAGETTGTNITSGKRNTELLIASGRSTNSAAYLTSILSYNGYDDWFLPGRDALALLSDPLVFPVIEDSVEDGLYWSSSELTVNEASSYSIVQSKYTSSYMTGDLFVRPMRLF